MLRRYSSSVRIFYPRYSLEEVVSRVRDTANRLAVQLGLLKVVIFGSYARKRFTAASDVDILIVYDDGVCDGDRVYNVFRTNLQLQQAELHILSKKEYESIKDSRWLKTVRDEGITVHDAGLGM